jgi:alpha 1,6-mannosyltransferase
VGWGDNVVRQFASWTMMAKPRSPYISMVVDDIVDALREKTQQHNVTIIGLKFDMIGDVVNLASPRRFTKSVLKSLDLMINGTPADRNISYLLELKLVGDVLVFPGYLFAASANTYDEVQGPALVTHHYAGTWKNEYGGEQT